MTIPQWTILEFSDYLADHGLDLLLQYDEDAEDLPWLATCWLQHEPSDRWMNRSRVLAHALEDVLSLGKIKDGATVIRTLGDQPRKTGETAIVAELASMLGIHDALIQVPSLSDRPWVVTLWRRGAPYVRACSTGDHLDETLADALQQMTEARDEYDEDPDCV